MAQQICSISLWSDVWKIDENCWEKTPKKPLESPVRDTENLWRTEGTKLASGLLSSRALASLQHPTRDPQSFQGRIRAISSKIILTYTPTGPTCLLITKYPPKKTRISLRHLPSRCPKKCHSRSAVALSSPEVGTWLARCSACPCNDVMLWCRDAIFPGRVPVLAVTWCFFFYKNPMSLPGE